MRVIGKFNDILQDFQGNAIASFKILNFIHKEMLNELEKDKEYSIEIKEIKNKRTLQQNRFLWLLMHEIDVAINGKPTDEMSVYITCLERANAKCDYIGALEETEPMLKENFRAIKKIKEIDLNGKKGYMYKVFLGSSKMDTKEMNLLIETVLDVAEEVGVTHLDDYWREVLK